MSGKILIVDSVATNRIVLKVKMNSAQYSAEACADCAAARTAITSDHPDLLLINLSDQAEDRHAFCRSLRGDPKTARMAIIGVGIADTTRARFAALDAGVDDVLSHPISDVLMQARIRSLLRRRQGGFEWQLRDGTRNALGFDEEIAPRLAPLQIAVIPDDTLAGERIAAQFQRTCGQTIPRLSTAAALAYSKTVHAPDVFVIDGSLRDRSAARLFQMISDLNSRNETRHSAKLVYMDQGQADVAAMLLDLDVDEIVFDGISDDELALRVHNLTARKLRSDSLRDRVRNGLQAAVTDPLTGLHNRRYADTQLQRLADQSDDAGAVYAMMVVDIDHFKSINDSHGHAAGDAILTALAERLRQNFRAIDLIARIGGEEFLVAMPETSAAQAEMAAQRLRHLVESKPFIITADAEPLSVTVSVGVAVSSVEATSRTTLGQMMKDADAALYDAKSAGRNAVAMASVAA